MWESALSLSSLITFATLLEAVCIYITLSRKKYSRRLLGQFFCRHKSRRALRPRQSEWSVCHWRCGLLKNIWNKSWGRRDKEKEEKMEDPQAGLGSLQPWQVGRCLEKELWIFYRNFSLNAKHLHKPSVVSFNPGPFSLQLFTAMFVGFWATSAYFDHFLLTGVFCIAYGVVAEVISLKFELSV